MRRKRYLFKRIVAFCTITAIILSTMKGMYGTNVSAATTDYGLSNPTKNADGKVVYDCIYFGNYWQEDTNGDGKANKQDDKTPIKWRVLSVHGDDAFLVADKILDVQTYNHKWKNVTWETSTIRSWLNGYEADANDCGYDYSGEGDNFINDAFETEEQAALKTTAIEDKKNPFLESTDSGNNTEDKIFLLSLEDMANTSYGFSNFTLPPANVVYDENGEATEGGNGDIVGVEYYGEGEFDYYDIIDYAKLRTVTAFAGRDNIDFKDDKGWKEELDTATSWGYCSGLGTNEWWLRSLGRSTGATAADVSVDGHVYFWGSAIIGPGHPTGNDVYGGGEGVVPALHLNLSHTNLWSKTDSVICTAEGIGLSSIRHSEPDSEPEENPNTKPAETNPSEPSTTEPSTTVYGLSNPTKNADGKVVYDCIYFGNYWQRDTNGDGKANKQDDKTPIKWRVLSVHGDDAFLVADRVLDDQVYSDKAYSDITWETCTMRSWLNGYGPELNMSEVDYTGTGNSFINNAFTQEEQAVIKISTVENKDNPLRKDGGIGGNDTNDKIFLLSLEDIANSSYGFSNFTLPPADTTYDENGMATEGGNGLYIAGTERNSEDDDDENYVDVYDYAKLHIATDFIGGTSYDFEKDTGMKYGLDTATGEGCCGYIGTCDWWLRSPGHIEPFNNNDDPSRVEDSGALSYIGHASFSGCGVVPALHLNLSNSKKLWTKADSVICTFEGIKLSSINQDKYTPKQEENPSTKPTEPEPSSSSTTEASKTPETTENPTTPGNTQITEKPTTSDKSDIPAVSKMKGVKATAGKKKLQIKWTKITDAAGYQLQISKKKNFKGAKTITLKKSVTKYTVKKLKSKKKYYIRIRAYKNYESEGKAKKIYGNWTLINKKVK